VALLLTALDQLVKVIKQKLPFFLHIGTLCMRRHAMKSVHFLLKCWVQSIP
jgi:hypothetical protein